MSRVIKGASNLGKIARDYGMGLQTLKDLIKAYPELQKEIDLHLVGITNTGQKTLPPITVNRIYEALGEP